MTSYLLYSETDFEATYFFPRYSVGVLAATGYIAGAIGEQPQAVLTGINAVRFLVPCLACVLYIILIQFYPEKKM